MAATKALSWLAYRRRRWLVGFVLAGVGLGAWVALSRGDPDFVLYNKSARPLDAVRVTVGVTVVDFPPLAADESVVRPLPLRGGGEIGFWFGGEPPRHVTGPWVEPGETAQVIARVDEFGEVVFSQVPTWRSRVLSALR